MPGERVPVPQMALTFVGKQSIPQVIIHQQFSIYTFYAILPELKNARDGGELNIYLSQKATVDWQNPLNNSIFVRSNKAKKKYHREYFGNI